MNDVPKHANLIYKSNSSVQETRNVVAILFVQKLIGEYNSTQGQIKFLFATSRNSIKSKSNLFHTIERFVVLQTDWIKHNMM